MLAYCIEEVLAPPMSLKVYSVRAIALLFNCLILFSLNVWGVLCWAFGSLQKRTIHPKAALNCSVWHSLTFGNVKSSYLNLPDWERSGFPQLQARERDVHSCPANEICSPPFLLESCPIFWQMGKTTFFSCMLLSKSNHFGGFVIVWATLGMATVIRILEYLNGH